MEFILLCVAVVIFLAALAVFALWWALLKLAIFMIDRLVWGRP